MTETTFHLAGADDRPGFWRQARLGLASGVPPHEARFVLPDDARDLFSAAPPAAVSLALDNNDGSAATPADAIAALVDGMLLHAAPERFALAYRLLWRAQREPALASIASDPDVARAGDMGKSVRRDMHKMTAFVRFRARPGGESGETHYIAWFEPEHHIVRAVAPFFVRRFTGMHWSILTPRCSAHWDGEALTFSAGAVRADAPEEDPLEDVWRTYYGSTFNPARLKVKAMTAQMPKKYWHNLPEAEMIAPLVEGIAIDDASMPHMAVRTGRICGVPCRLFRVSFTGELGFEINVPADYGRAVWEAVYASGTKFDITPYGTEAMHVLRAEKGYIIVGQETDGTTREVRQQVLNPLGAIHTLKDLTEYTGADQDEHHHCGEAHGALHGVPEQTPRKPSVHRCQNHGADHAHCARLGRRSNGGGLEWQTPHGTEYGQDQSHRRNDAFQALAPKGPALKRARFLGHAWHVVWLDTTEGPGVCGKHGDLKQ